MAKRTKLELRADILRVARDGANKTRIVYGAYLNFDIVNGHLSELINDGRIVKTGRRYFTTGRGVDYIGHIDAVSGREAGSP
jgi:predicted transcriptional regulator